MRILQVSAHYPPDFVSGGTLVPQRIAIELQRRGHEVSVFAGHLHDDRPLRAWDETHEGVPVRWVSVRSFTEWGSRDGFDNPGVATAFASYLDETAPDVVHFHSLQTLGGALLPLARERGAVVVVTMHDFWWVCARQFLVAPDREPCSLVVAAGVCPCAQNPRWLRDRNAWLLRQLRSADLLLSPSATAASVLIANGIDLGRLRVDENGLPAGASPVSTPRLDLGQRDIPVRLLFTGGPDPMKGLPILRRALGQLADVDGWELSAYGTDSLDWIARDPRVRPLPRYVPEDLPAILANHDVLVLPSLMRESYSIVTREAQQAGLPVICTDTLGPEEVVRHDVNGLIVPAGDAVGLAAAMRRVVEEPGVLERLRQGGGASQPQVRSLDDQVHELEASYRSLLRTGPVSIDGTPSIRRVLFVAGIDGAPLRYRARLPAEGLGLLGIHTDVHHYRDPAIAELASSADAVVFYRVPATDQVLDLIASVRSRTPAVPTLFDVDDLIFDDALRGDVHGIDHLSPDEQELWWEGVRRYRTTMSACDVYVGSTPALCRHAAEVTGMPSRLFANGVGILLAQCSDVARRSSRTPGPMRVGYFSGTDTHDHDWAVAEPAVVRLLTERPQLELWLGGPVRPTDALDRFTDRVRRLPFGPWQTLPSLLRDVDVNLAPLAGANPFNEAKSAIKWLESALVGTPTVATPTEPFRDAIESGVDGLLAADSDQWYAAVGSLLDDDSLRTAVGERARRSALLRYSPHLQGRRYAALLSEAAELVQRTPRRPALPPLATRNEPYDGSQLSTYEAPELASRLDASLGRVTAAGRLTAYGRATVVSLQQRGGTETARDVARVLRRTRPTVVRRLRERLRH